MPAKIKLTSAGAKVKRRVSQSPEFNNPGYWKQRIGKEKKQFERPLSALANAALILRNRIADLLKRTGYQLESGPIGKVQDHLGSALTWSRMAADHACAAHREKWNEVESLRKRLKEARKTAGKQK